MALQEFFESTGESRSWSFEEIARDLEDESPGDGSSSLGAADEPWRDLPSWGSLQVEPEWASEARLEEVFASWSAGNPVGATAAEKSFLGDGWATGAAFPGAYTEPEGGLVESYRAPVEAAEAVANEPVLAPVELYSAFEETPEEESALTDNRARTWRDVELPTHPQDPSTTEVISAVDSLEEVDGAATGDINSPVAADAEPSPRDPWLDLIGDPTRTEVPAVFSPTGPNGLVPMMAPHPGAAPSPVPIAVSPPMQAGPFFGYQPPIAYAVPLTAYLPHPGFPTPAQTYPLTGLPYVPPDPSNPYGVPQSVVARLVYEQAPMSHPALPTSGTAGTSPPWDSATARVQDLPPPGPGDDESWQPDFRGEAKGSVDVVPQPAQADVVLQHSPAEDVPQPAQADVVLQHSPVDVVPQPAQADVVLQPDPLEDAGTANPGDFSPPATSTEPNGAADSREAANRSREAVAGPSVPLDDPFVVISSSTYMVEFANPYTVCVDATDEIIGNQPWEVDTSPLPQLYAMVAGQVRLTDDNLVELEPDQVDLPEPEIYSWASPGFVEVPPLETEDSAAHQPMRINGWTVVSASNDILPDEDVQRRRRRRR